MVTRPSPYGTMGLPRPGVRGRRKWVDQPITEERWDRTLTSVDHSEPTAQSRYKETIRDHVAPWLREQGFKGSGNHFTTHRDSFVVHVDMQKSKWNTRDLVNFDVNVSVIHPGVQASFQEANNEARSLNKELEHPDTGNYWNRLSRLDPAKSGEFPWVVTVDSEPGEIGADVIRCLRDFFLPTVDQEIRKPLPRPTPPQERPERPSREERDAASLAHFLDEIVPKMREMGLIVGEPKLQVDE